VKRISLFLCGFFFSLSLQSSYAVSLREECFPFEELPPHLQVIAEKVLLKALDSEALYTFVGDLKPMSQGFIEFEVKPSDERVGNLSLILSKFHCGREIQGALVVFDSKSANHAIASSFIGRPSLIEKKRLEFQTDVSSLPVDESFDLADFVSWIDQINGRARFKNFGMYFGYPKYAVDFFLEAQRKELENGETLERDFYSVPTFAADSSRFIWATPLPHQEQEVDREIRRVADQVLERYRLLRARHITSEGTGALALIREWYYDKDLDGNETWKPENARFSACETLL
jgi:hypothetical protein